MNLGCGSKLLATIAACGVAVVAQASTISDEASLGDFSNNGLSPTPLVFTTGSNTVIGTTGNAGQPGGDRDYFSFTMPAGTVLSSVMLLSNTATAGVSFIGIQPGPQLTVTPSGGGVQNLVALGHFGNDQIGTDLLPSLLVSGTSPLPGGTYSVWVQELSSTIPYGFDFKVSPVPLPGAAALLFSGLLGLATLRRRRVGVA